MKTLFTLMLAATVSVSAFSQSEVKEKDIIGQWDLIIDLDEIEDEIERDLEDENWLAARFAKSISNFALDIVGEIDIRMDFREDGEVKISVNAFGARETEYAEWYINRDGELVIEDDDNRRRRDRRINIGDDDDVWLMKGDKLVSYEKGYRGRLKRQEVYMVKR
ncbi:MAG: hypothetical protein HEP71_09505 [Roseivirga sp.]|nr:hypothetical protein [Roseivirga sp.]